MINNQPASEENRWESHYLPDFLEPFFFALRFFAQYVLIRSETAFFSAADMPRRFFLALAFFFAAGLGAAASPDSNDST